MPSSRYKERQSCLLLPAKEDLMQWHLEALKATMPLNLYIYEMVEKARRIDTTPDIPRLNETADLKEEISALKKDLASKIAEIEKLQTDLFTSKRSIALQHTPDGQGSLSSDLVELLQAGRVLRSEALMRSLKTILEI
jgi:hypothetical protein